VGWRLHAGDTVLQWCTCIIDVSLRWTIRGGKTSDGHTVGGENNHTPIKLLKLKIFNLEFFVRKLFVLRIQRLRTLVLLL